MQKLHALVRRVSDTTLIGLTLSSCLTLIISWYTWWYTPSQQDHVQLSEKVTRLHKRISSLKKRVVSSSSLAQEVSQLSYIRHKQAKQLPKESDALAHVLAVLKATRVTLLSWQPQDALLYEYSGVRTLIGEFLGTYEQLLQFLKQVPSEKLMLRKTAEGLYCSCSLQVHFRREV